MKFFITSILLLLVAVIYLGTGHSGWQGWPTSALQQDIVFQIRLPRLLLAMANGVALGLAGATLQIILRNPLAEPGITGVAGGAALATVLAMYTGWLLPVSWWLPLVGMSGGAVSLALLWLIAGANPSGTRLILGGVAIASFSGALIALVLNLAPNPFAFQEWSLWLMGSVANRGWSHLALMAPCVLVGALLLFSQRQFITAHIFDPATLRSLGFNARRASLLVLFAVTLLVSASVITAGVVSFIGLLAPHAVRLIGIQRPYPLLVWSAVAGALLMAVIDLVIRLIPTAVELQLGVVAAFLGAPLLVILLRRPYGDSDA
ncbi:iron ABC transporter permease [Pseudidiomarina sp.]|uniref:FecCD family ABC transporter permease n=1 Tax=Pseudidiomarina sp. TaxID=2081707 RepID=UPI00299D382B|nr:iron ABC transporter permease [Pseudidiomarina sp.]MDX1706244.1 iron ABC transporter permease [Pseudidiomarina sp.]